MPVRRRMASCKWPLRHRAPRLEARDEPASQSSSSWEKATGTAMGAKRRRGPVPLWKLREAARVRLLHQNLEEQRTLLKRIEPLISETHEFRHTQMFADLQEKIMRLPPQDPIRQEFERLKEQRAKLLKPKLEL